MFLLSIFLFSCGSSETKPSPAKPGIDTLHYEEPDTARTDSTATLIDSLVSVSAATPTTIDDGATLALKARLAADTFSAKISDSVKKEIRDARDYMQQKHNPQ